MLLTVLSAVVCGSVFEVPLLTAPPVIDGRIEGGELKNTLLISGAGQNVDPRRSQVFLGWTKDFLYIGMRSEMPPLGKLALNRSSLGPVSDDSLELWLVPPVGKRELDAAKFGEFQLIVNHIGETHQIHHNPGYGLPAKAWKGKIQVANSIHDGVWDCEVAIPARELGFEQLREGDWKMLFVRNFRVTPGKQSPFTQVNGFMNSGSYADFRLSSGGMVVQNDYSTDSARFPDRFTASRPGTLEVKIGNDEFSRQLTAGSPVDLGERQPKKSAPVSYTVKDEAGKIVFSRNINFEPPPARIWNNLESYITLRQDFSGKADQLVWPPQDVNAVVKGEVSMIPGRTDSEQAADFAQKGAGIVYQNGKISIPGAIAMWLKVDNTPLGKSYRRFFSSNFRSSGYIGLQEVGNKFLFFAHSFNAGGNKNLLTSKAIPKNEWICTVVNLMPGRAEIYVNGIRYGEIDLGFDIDPATLGDLVVGQAGAGGFAIDEITVYGRTLEQAEIKKLAQGETKVTGAISWYQALDSLVLDITCNPEQLKIQTLLLKVNNAENKQLFSSEINLKDGYSNQQLQVIHRQVPITAKLPEGRYIASLSVPNSENALMEKEFQVKYYPWLNNNLGTNDILLPPFTALKVRDQVISCILRDYHISGNGLPSQVVAKEKNILAAPMKLMIQHRGKQEAQPEGKLIFTKKSDTAVDYTAKSAGKYLNVETQGHMEFDGLLKLDLILNQVGDAPEQIWLDIPVKKEFATLFHASGEHIRANPAGFVPAGEGTIWKSRSIPQINISNFIPYIWLGDDERGISYAADWDRGWSHSEERDAVELFRHANGDISIRLHLLNAPFTLKKDHRITIALMGSPVKPMPTGWRGWSDGFGFKGTRIGKCLMSNPYWGSYFTWTGRYPAFEDFECVRKLTETRKTGVIDQEFVKSWLDRLANASPAEAPWLKKSGQPFAVRHTNAAFNMMKGLHAVNDKTTVYFYTCNWDGGASALPEFPVFQDEWQPRVHVFKSYADYAIYYLNKMLDSGMDGVYNDNTFFAANFSWATGNAYIDDNGEVRPSLGLWRVREYHKRQLTLMVERGMNPWITAHHTNGNILPTLSFVTNVMGMEWKYGEQDFQLRFSPDYIRAVNQGRQGGFFPTSLDGITGKDPAKRTWATRTMLSVLLPHEVRPTCPRQCDGGLYRKIHDRMYDFGIGEPDCVFHAYWDANNPVKANHDKLLPSVYKRGTKLLIFCGSYADDVNAELQTGGLVRSAVNAETGEALPVKDGIISFPLKKHDFILIEAETAK